MSIDEVLDMLCEALEIEPGSLKEDTRIDCVDAWDSIGWMSVLAVADQRFGVHIAPTTTKELQTAGDVARYVMSKA